MVQTFDISNFDYLIFENSLFEIFKVFHIGLQICIGIRKSEFVPKTQFL